MEDATDALVEDSIGSAKPLKPAKPRDPERTKRLLMQVIAVAAVATAVFSGVNAWETHQDRVQSKKLYCAIYAPAEDSGDSTDSEQFIRPSPEEMRKALDC